MINNSVTRHDPRPVHPALHLLGALPFILTAAWVLFALFDTAMLPTDRAAPCAQPAVAPVISLNV